jgi:hypothetical protein
VHRFVNGYLIVFLLDATLSVLDDQLGLAGIASPISGLRSSVASVAVFYAIPIFWSLAPRPDIPRSVVLPLTSTTFWFALGGLPLPLYFGVERGLASLSAIQLGVSLLVFLRVRHLTGGRWLFDATTLPARPARVVSAIAFTLATLLITPLATGAYLVAMIPLAVESGTGGFLRVASDGVYAQTRVYRRDDRLVYLTGMIHVGDREFYESVFNDLADDNPTILLEGVTDDQGLLDDGFSYRAVASIFDLEAQGQAGGGSPLPYPSVWADLDVSELLPETRAFLNRLTAVLANETLEAFLSALLIEFASEQPSLEVLHRISYDINERRSAHAIGVLERELDESPTILMAWGALHMPAFVEAVEALGFDWVDSRDRRAIAF